MFTFCPAWESSIWQLSPTRSLRILVNIELYSSPGCFRPTWVYLISNCFVGGNSILRSIVQLVFKILWKLCTVEGQPFPSFKHKFYSLWPQSSSKLWPRENWSAKLTKCSETSSEQSQFHGQYRVQKGTVWHNELSFMKPCDWIR